MFCHNCGKRFNHNGNFCSDCGEPRLKVEIEDSVQDDGPAAEKTAKKKKPVAAKTASIRSGEAARAWTDYWERALPLEQQLEGFVNAEEAQLWISDGPIFSCGACDKDFSHKYKRVGCSLCGKTKGNSVAVPIGSGDGTYPVIQFLPSDPSLSSILGIWASHPSENFSSPLPDFLRAVLESDWEACSAFEQQAKMDLASFIMEDEYELTSFGSIEVSSADASFGNFDLPDLAKILISGPRARNFLDCAEVRVGWLPGEYEILGVTRAGEVDRIEASVQADEWIQQPDILAILVIKKDELSGVVPQTKVIRDAFEVGFFSMVERWIVAARVSRGDLLAVWANWELINEFGGTGDLAGVFSSLSMEGYLHQIWNWVTTNPPKLESQLESHSDFGPRFSQLIEWSAQPGTGLSREQLSEWFR